MIFKLNFNEVTAKDFRRE